MYTDPDGMVYRVCQRDDDGKETNCTSISDAAFGNFQEQNKNTLTFTGKGQIFSSGNQIGTYQQTSVDLDPQVAQALSTAGTTADVLIKGAAKEMAVNAAMTATGVIALRGLGYAAEAAQSLGVFKNTKVVINFV